MELRLCAGYRRALNQPGAVGVRGIATGRLIHDLHRAARAATIGRHSDDRPGTAGVSTSHRDNVRTLRASEASQAAAGEVRRQRLVAEADVARHALATVQACTRQLAREDGACTNLAAREGNTSKLRRLR